VIEKKALHPLRDYSIKIAFIPYFRAEPLIRFAHHVTSLEITFPRKPRFPAREMDNPRPVKLHNPHIGIRHVGPGLDRNVPAAFRISGNRPVRAVRPVG